MDEPKTLRNLASSLLAEAKDAATAKAAAEILKLTVELEKGAAETRKLLVEEQKLQTDIAQSLRISRTDNRKYYVSLLTPLLSTIVLAGTLALQTWQFTETEKQKRNEAQRQEAEAQDLRWAETIKALERSDQLLANTALLKPYLTSPRFGASARTLAFQLLVQTNRQEIFRDLFLATFAPVNWDNLPQALELARSLKAEYEPLVIKDQKKRGHLGRLERARSDELYDNIVYVSHQIEPLLKAKRPNGQTLDLRSVMFMDSDLSNADLSGADLRGFIPNRVILKGVDLSGVTQFTTDVWAHLEWWKAFRISPDFLSALQKDAPFKVGSKDYRSTLADQKHYEEDIARLWMQTKGQ